MKIALMMGFYQNMLVRYNENDVDLQFESLPFDHRYMFCIHLELLDLRSVLFMVLAEHFFNI